MTRARVLVIFLAAATSLASRPAHAQTADEIVARNLQAKGGVDALKSTTTVRMTGTVSSPQGELTMVTIAKRPNLVRRDLMTAGRKSVTGFDGATVWMQQDEGPAQEIKGPRGDAARSEAEFDSIFLDYKQKGHVIELVGKETYKGRPVYHLRVVRKGGPVQHYYLDAETALESRISTEVASETGQKGSVETDLSDYRAVDGRVVPFKMTQLFNGAQVAQITFEKIEFNPPLPDATFKMPR